MFDLLFENIERKIKITEEDKAFCKTLFIPKKLRKKQYLLQAGDISEYVAFVTKGLLRSYSVDEKGEEHIIQFAPEDWWITDMNSFLTSEEAIYNIDALEDTEILLLDKPSQDKLFEQIPMFERYFRILIQASFVAMHKRLLSTITNTAEEKYMRMLKTYPDLVQRVPQHMIASFLGIKPETISRIRKKQASNS
jgi:CRP-like cAMP-binding protein